MDGGIAAMLKEQTTARLHSAADSLLEQSPSRSESMLSPESPLTQIWAAEACGPAGQSSAAQCDGPGQFGVQTDGSSIGEDIGQRSESAIDAVTQRLMGPQMQ